MIYPQGGFGPFLSTPSARRATAGRHGSSATVAISIHALREEGDPPSSKSGRPSANFYPRPPRGGRLFCAARAASSRVFLSTPSARRATRAGEPFLLLPEISIHALREEGDLSAMFLIVRSDYFYPRPPRGGRQKARTTAISIPQFLSTPSARRATWPVSLICPVMLFLSTPSARRATSRPFPSFGLCPFLSTPSARRATCRPSARWCRLHYFYPRPPRGGRLSDSGKPQSIVKFLSTPSARRATCAGFSLASRR